MSKFNKFLTLVFIAIFSAGQSNACQTLMVVDFIEEIKAKDGDFRIKEITDGFYIDPNLLMLQDDGIHIRYGDHDFLIPFIYHDTKGYFLSREACHNLGNRWLCCTCNAENKMLNFTCHRCLKTRCPTLR